MSSAENNLLSRLTELGTDFKAGGSEIVIKECPFCHPHRDQLDNLWKLNINAEKSVYFCHRCSARGTVNQYFEKVQHQAWSEKIWGDSLVPGDDAAKPLQLYLKNRGLSSELMARDIRLHPTLRYQKEIRFPALVAKVSDLSGKIVGLQRIFLTPEGKKAPVSPVKKSLGAIMGGAVHLDPAADTLAVAEGIETALAVRQATRLPTWSAVSALGMERLIVPAPVKIVRIFADLDPSGKGEKAAEALAARLHKEGKRVFVHVPKVDTARRQ